jgi:ribulose bisphosphate carboxylase small subunit
MKMIAKIENTTITDYINYQTPKNNLKNLIGNQEKMKSVIVNDDRYFGTGYWLARKDCFSKKTQEKLQQLTDQEVQNVNDYKENRTYLRIQDKEDQIHNMAMSVREKDNGLLEPIRVVKGGFRLGKYLFDIILLKNEDGDITILNSGLYNALSKEGLKFYLTDNNDLTALFKDNQRVGVMCPLSRKIFDYLPEDIYELSIIENNQREIV